MEPRKQAICDALRTWINQRPGFDPNNYDRAGYLSDSRKLQQQARDARELLRAVELSSITADALIAAFPQAFGGRLTISQRVAIAADPKAVCLPGMFPFAYRLDYVAGQYMPTEYRAAACAVLASALWTYTREECMPPVAMYGVKAWGDNQTWYALESSRELVEKDLAGRDGDRFGYIVDAYKSGKSYLSAGDWLRAQFKQQFGRGIASRWFS